MAQFLYQAPPIHMRFSRENGEAFTVRVIASTLRNGVLINSIPTNLQETFNLFEAKSENRTLNIQFLEEGTQDIYSKIYIEFYEVIYE